jgi:hypothetical protein
VLTSTRGEILAVVSGNEMQLRRLARKGGAFTTPYHVRTLQLTIAFNLSCRSHPRIEMANISLDTAELYAAFSQAPHQIPMLAATTRSSIFCPS